MKNKKSFFNDTFNEHPLRAGELGLSIIMLYFFKHVKIIKLCHKITVDLIKDKV